MFRDKYIGGEIVKKNKVMIIGKVYLVIIFGERVGEGRGCDFWGLRSFWGLAIIFYLLRWVMVKREFVLLDYFLKYVCVFYIFFCR